MNTHHKWERNNTWGDWRCQKCNALLIDPYGDRFGKRGPTPTALINIYIDPDGSQIWLDCNEHLVMEMLSE